eukprot:g786.t1
MFSGDITQKSDAIVKEYLAGAKRGAPLAVLNVDVNEGIRQELENAPGIAWSAIACLGCPFSLGLSTPSNCTGKAQSYTRKAFTSFAAALKVELYEDHLVVETTQPYNFPALIYSNVMCQDKTTGPHCCYILPHCRGELYGENTKNPMLRVIRLRDITKVESIVRKAIIADEPCCGTPTNNANRGRSDALLELHSHLIIGNVASPWGNHGTVQALFGRQNKRPPISVTILNGKDADAFAEAVRRQKEVSSAKSESAIALPPTVLKLARDANPEWDPVAYMATVNAQRQMVNAQQQVERMGIPVSIDGPDAPAVVAPKQLGFERMTEPTAPAVATVESPLVNRLRQLANLQKEGILSDEEYAAAKAKAIEKLS